MRYLAGEFPDRRNAALVRIGEDHGEMAAYNMREEVVAYRSGRRKR